MRASLLIAACCVAVTPANAAAAKASLLQVVDLTDKGMSTEGGEAKLYRIEAGAARRCRLDVIHFGETGKTTLSFSFGATLLEAVKSEYRYAAPIYTDPTAKAVLSRRITLASWQGRRALRRDFTFYKSFFRAGALASCSSR